MPFVKGKSGNLAGRPKGTKDKITAEIRDLAQSIFTPAYWARVKKQALEGTLHPKIEERLLSYAYGVPLNEQPAASMQVVIGMFTDQPVSTTVEVIEQPYDVISTTSNQEPATRNSTQVMGHAAHVALPRKGSK